MHSLAIIGTSLAGAVVGGIVGSYMGDRTDNGDFIGLGAFMYGSFGLMFGGFSGVILGALLFAR